MVCHADLIPSHPIHCDPVIIVASATMVAIVLMAADNCSGGGQVDSIRLHSIPQRLRPQKQQNPDKTEFNTMEPHIYFVTSLETVLYGLLIEAETINICPSGSSPRDGA